MAQEDEVALEETVLMVEEEVAQADMQVET
jgi:hypothetical protein